MKTEHLSKLIHTQSTVVAKAFHMQYGYVDGLHTPTQSCLHHRSDYNLQCYQHQQSRCDERDQHNSLCILFDLHPTTWLYYQVTSTKLQSR